jgi:hypothetical protein
MSVAAIGAIFSRDADPAQQQSGLRVDLRGLQKALASGSLAAAQQAFSRFQQDLQGIRPQTGGVRPSADVNPQSTTRADAEALQKALNSGDLPAAERAFIRLQQDSQQIAAASAQQENPITGQSSQAAKALPEQSGESNQRSQEGNGGSGKDGIDVYA